MFIKSRDAEAPNPLVTKSSATSTMIIPNHKMGERFARCKTHCSLDVRGYREKKKKMFPVHCFHKRSHAIIFFTSLFFSFSFSFFLFFFFFFFGRKGWVAVSFQTSSHP
jgi:hypothetical protein